MNLETEDDIKAYLVNFYCDRPMSDWTYPKPDFDLLASTFTKVHEYTVLSPYYFIQSKNDPDNSLKPLLTRTYSDKRNYIQPLMEQK